MDLFYGLNDKCVNCSDDATLFQHNTTTGFYEVVGTGEHVHDLLNAESEKQSYGMMWTSQLDLVVEWVEPSSSSSTSTSPSSSSSSSLVASASASSPSSQSVPLSGGIQHSVSTLCIAAVVVGLLGHMTMAH